MTRRVSGFRLLLIALGVAVLVGTLGGITYAAFSAATANPTSSFEAKPVYLGQRVTSAWSVTDYANGGAGTDGSNPTAFEDARTRTTAAFATTHSASRYVDFVLNSPLPPGLSVTSATLNVRHLPTTAARNACFFVEIRSAATPATVLGQYGSTGSPYCRTGSTFQTEAISIPVVDTTAKANDLRVRLYGWVVGGAEGIRLDQVTVTGSTAWSGFNLYESSYTDNAAGGSTAAVPWGPVASDGTVYQTATGWATAFQGTRYASFRFPAYLPNAAEVTGARLSHRFGPVTAGTACTYIEVYSGSTLLSTPITSGSPSCTTTWKDDLDLALAAVDTAAEANSLVVRVYGRHSASGATRHDLLELELDYDVESGSTPGGGGCGTPGSTTVNVTRDSFVNQASVNENKGTDSKLLIRTKSGNQNSRAVVWASLPTIPSGCALQEARFHIYGLTQVGNRTIQAYRLSPTPAWTETGVTWSNVPALTGSAATTATGTSAGWRAFDVTTQVAEMYTNGNNGLLLKDSVENSGTEYLQEYAAREDSSFGDPYFYLAWG